MPVIVDIALRGVIVFAFFCAAVVALTHWAVRSQRLNAFGAWARFIRRVSDPILVPFERRIIGMGGNPQDAPFWLLGAVVIGGLVLLWLFRWVASLVVGFYFLSQSGPDVWVAALIHFVFSALKVAIIVRVIASWFGRGRYNRWLRPFYWLTDWIIQPLRRVVPTLGPIDITPIVAYFLVILVERLLLGLLAG